MAIGSLMPFNFHTSQFGGKKMNRIARNNGFFE
jgi:hypothetical protein